jgi:hypothetical protein
MHEARSKSLFEFHCEIGENKALVAGQIKKHK